MPIRLHTVGLVVKDMPRALAFYRALGLHIPAEEDHAPHVEFTGTGGVVMGFDTEAMVLKTDPKWTAPAGGQRVNLQFELGSAAGEYAAPWDAFWGQRFARVTDPDGNVVSLFAELG
jgi:catechol 2,3-dioxygenase-like lactoylglutathione lyase family enzyme